MFLHAHGMLPGGLSWRVEQVMATAHFFCPFPGAKAAEKTKGYPGTGPTLAMGPLAHANPCLISAGCGAAVSERQTKWPTSFDFAPSYLHVEELWQCLGALRPHAWH